MILYHGSNISIDKIDLEMSKPNKDFGKGFYLSEDETQAIEMAKFKSALLGGEAVITRFEFDIAAMQNSDIRTKYFRNIQKNGLTLYLQTGKATILSSTILYMVPLPMTRLVFRFAN